MLRVNEMRHVDSMCGSGGEVAVRSHAAAHICAYGALAVVIVGCFFGTSALAQAPVPAVITKHAATAPATSSSKHPNLAKKAVVSPYARAAAQRERSGQAPAGHPQPVGKPHRPSQSNSAGRPQ
jgi:hypothetical protein